MICPSKLQRRLEKNPNHGATMSTLIRFVHDVDEGLEIQLV